MIYIFRFLDKNDTPTGWFGIVNAKTQKDLFWAIDAHGDPRRVELKRIPNRSGVTFFIDNTGSMIDLELSESIEDAMLINDKYWFKPKWESDNELLEEMYRY